MRLIQAVLAAIFLSSCATGLAGGHAVQAGQPARRLTVVGINDTHGALLAAKPERWAREFTSDLVGGADWFAGYLAAIRAEAKEKKAGGIVRDRGHLVQGTLISNGFKRQVGRRHL